LLTTAANQQYEDDIDLLRYGRFLAAYWPLLLAGTMAGAVAGLAVAWRAPVRYQASTTLAIAANGTTSLALTPAASRALFANLSLVAETIDELQLNRDGLTPQSFIEDALDVQTVPTTNLLKVSVSLRDPTKARLAAGTLAQKALNLGRRLDQEGAVTGRDAIKKQMDDAAQRLDAAQDRLLKYQSSAQVDMLQAQTDSKIERRYQMSKVAIELASERARLATMERELARSESPGAGSSQSSPDPVSGRLQYEVAESRARVASLEKQHNESLRAAGGPATVKELNELYRRKLELSRLQAEYDVSEGVYSDLATRYEEARGRVVGIMPQLQIVDPPVQPDRPLPRRLPQFAILGGLMGLIAAAVAAVVLNRRAAQPLA
jgi:uncharacterized protein involved in exopolysaccharide biosynthesis